MYIAHLQDIHVCMYFHNNTSLYTHTTSAIPSTYNTHNTHKKTTNPQPHVNPHQLLYGRKGVDALVATKGWDLMRFSETQWLLWFDVAMTILFACLASYPRVTGMRMLYVCFYICVCLCCMFLCCCQPYKHHMCCSTWCCSLCVLLPTIYKHHIQAPYMNTCIYKHHICAQQHHPPPHPPQHPPTIPPSTTPPPNNRCARHVA